MFEFHLQSVMGRKAEFFDFYHRCVQEVGALDLAELRDLAARDGIDAFLAGWVIGNAKQSVVRDQGRVFLVAEPSQRGCFELPSDRPGFAARFDSKRAAFESTRAKGTETVR